MVNLKNTIKVQMILQVTISMLVPPLLVFLAKHPLVDKYDLSSLKELWCGAAPLAKETQIAVQKRIGVKRIQQGYGMTETTLAVLHNGNSEIKPGSCGLVVPGTTAKVHTCIQNIKFWFCLMMVILLNKLFLGCRFANRRIFRTTQGR